MGSLTKAAEKNQIELGRCGERHHLWQEMGQKNFFLDVVRKGWQEQQQLCQQTTAGPGKPFLPLP